jgi:hypothetical protein
LEKSKEKYENLLIEIKSINDPKKIIEKKKEGIL